MVFRILPPSETAHSSELHENMRRLAALMLVGILAVAPRPAGAGGFAPGPSADYSVGTNPNSIAVADLNADGIPDMVVCNENGSGISVLIGNGNATFAPKVNYGTGQYPTKVVVADFDGDGKWDVAVLHRYPTNKINILRGTGTGTFTSGMVLNTPAHPAGLVAQDLNFDGKADLATCAEVSASMNFASVFLNTTSTGVLSFGSRSDYGCGVGPKSIATGKLATPYSNGKDLVTANYTAGSITILTNDGTGHFENRQDLPAPPHATSVAVGDIFPWSSSSSIVTANVDSSSVSVWTYIDLYPSPPTWVRGDYPVGPRPAGVDIADTDGDGILDVVSANYLGSSISVLSPDSTPDSYTSLFHPRVDIPTGASPYTASVADLDRDGKPDLVSASYNASSVRVTRGALRVGWALLDTIPDFSAPTQFGSTLSFHGATEGRWSLLDMCSVWCSPCISMAWTTQSTYMTLQAAGLPFQYLTMLNDGPTYQASTLQDAQSWAKRFRIQDPVLHSGGVAGSGVQGIVQTSELWYTPTLRLVDPNGVIRWFHVGAVEETTLVRVVANAAGIPVPPLVSPPPRTPVSQPPAEFTSGTETVTYGSQVASSPSDPSEFVTFPFNLPGGSFGENFTSFFSMDRNWGTQQEDWAIDLCNWPIPGKMDLPRQYPWQVTLSDLALDNCTRTLLSNVVTVTALDTFGVFTSAGTVQATWNGSTLVLGAVPTSALASLPPIRTLIFKLSMRFTPNYPTDVPNAEVPSLALRAPWPNPVTGPTRLAWSQAKGGAASLEVFDITGRRVRTLSDGIMAPGEHTTTWDLADQGGRRVGPGLYFVRLNVAGEGARTRRVTIVN